MSKTTLYLFLAAVVLQVLAVFFQVPFAAGGAGVVMLVGLIYAYVVTKREEERGELKPSEPAE